MAFVTTKAKTSRLALTHEVLLGQGEAQPHTGVLRLASFISFFHPSVTREVNSIYMRQPAIITGLTGNAPLSLPARPSATCSQSDAKGRHGLHWTSRGRVPAWVPPGPAEANCWPHPGTGCVLHLPLWTCLTAFPHGRADFLFSYIALSALISVNRLWCLLCWRRQPWQERTFNLFPHTEPWEAAGAPRHNSLGSSPKNSLKHSVA